MSIDTHERTCNKCGRVSFAVTREYAENEVEKFNAWLDSADAKTQAMYSRRSSVASYEACMACGNPHTNFRDSVPGDCPMGCTLNPIILE